MKKKYLECGKIVSTHGLRGELRVMHWCDSAEFLLGFKTLYLDGGAKPIAVENMRLNKNIVLLKLAGVDDIDTAVSLRGKVLYIDRDDAPEGDGEFLQDIIGMTVKDTDTGEYYGKLTDVFRTGANDVYEITGGDGAKRLIPAIPDVVIEADTDSAVMQIRPLKGLFGDE
ncbi:MAG: ribosome maturation factor RimM [Oscillospiraceae bacterium]|nr:ribosome maturation factor RimM [Oscillospiraceae bacterium]